MKNEEIVESLNTIAGLMEVKGEQQFRVRAYRDAASQIDLITEDIAELAAEDRLQEIPGVGASIAEKIREYLDTGRMQALEKLEREFPRSLRELLQVPGLGPRRVQQVYRALAISSVEALEEAARAGQLAGLPGFGERTQQSVLAGIRRLRERTAGVLVSEAWPLADYLVHSLQQMAGIELVAATGSLRRGDPWPSEVELVAASDDADGVLDSLGRIPEIRRTVARDATEVRALADRGVPVRVRVVPVDQFVLAALSAHPEHLAALQPLLAAGGLQLEPPGRLRRNGVPVPVGSEEEFYDLLGLPWISPELREGRGEVEAAASGALPRLLVLGDLQGDLHVHSTWSDGHDSIEAMARAAKALGRSYIAMADHSRSLAVARGMSVERLREQRREIEQLNARPGEVRVLAGIELDIKADGSLDYDDEILESFDFVTASVHSGFTQSGEQITRRIVSAMRNPHVDAIGHPTGRVLGRRDPLDVDLESVIRAAAETHTALEINSWPNRLDLWDEPARRARDAGAKLAINTDSHAADQLAFLRYGVAVARRAWLEPQDVLNAQPLDDLLAYLRSRPGKA